MIKSAGKKLLVAVLGICAALTMIFGVANFNRNGKITAKADSSTLSLLNLSKGHTDNAGSGFSAGNTILIHWADGSQSGSTWGCLNLKCGETDLSDLVVVATAEKSQTLKQWNAEKCITRAITYGQMFGINLEESGLKKSQVVSVTLKAGFAPITDASGWGNNAANVGTADLTKALPEDVKLWLNHTYGTLELDSTALKVTSQPETTEYLTGSTFNASGLAVTATTVLNGDVNLDISKLTYSYDFSTAGQKAVTISYGGQTATVDVTVSEPTKTLTGIKIKSGSVTIEQNGSASEMTLNDLKITASYEGEADEEKTVTADMISVDPAELGERQGKITYTEGGITKDCEVTVTVVARTSAFTAENIYVIPIDGYYAGEDGGDRKFDDDGPNIWFTTNAGYKQEKLFSGLTGGQGGWYDQDTFKSVYSEIKAHVLINEKTLDEFNADGKKLTRLLLGWYGDGLFTLRMHKENTFNANDIQTITLLKGFQMYNESAQALGAPTPCDYTYTVVAKPGTSDKMLVRKTESLTIVSAPTKTEYTEGEKFDPTGMTVKAVYTDGGEKTFAVKARMADVTTLNETGDVDVTITYNGKSVTQPITVNEKVVTVTGIAVKDNAKLLLKQYSLTKKLTDGAKITVSYSNGTSNDVDLTIDMVSGYTNETVGNDQEATVTYEGKTCAIKYDVEAYTGTSYFKGVNYDPIYGTEGTGYATLDGIDDVNAELKALWDVDKAPSLVMGKTNGDLVTINGVTLTQLVNDKQYASYKFARMLMNGRNFAFHIDDATFMNTVKNGAEICFLPGFSWVTYTTDKWGDSSQCANYTPIENAVITKPTYFCFKNGNVCKVIDSVTLGRRYRRYGT